MSHNLRLCHPFNFKFLLEYDGSDFVGAYGPFLTDLLRSVTRASNITLDISSQDEGMGERINRSTGLYSGCIGRLQTNQSDAILFLADYPHPAINISQGPVLLDTVMQILSAYSVDKNSVALLQAEKTFSSFSVNVWLLCLMTFVTTCCVLISGEWLMAGRTRMRRRARSVYWPWVYAVFLQMTNAGQLPMTSGAVRKIIFLVLSCFSFLVIFYLCSFIQTDLVVAEPPETLHSYQQLLDNQVCVVFFSGSDAYQSFKSAPKGSVQKKLWDLSLSKCGPNMTLFNFGKNPELLVPIGHLGISKKVVFIGFTEFTQFLMNSYCSVLFIPEVKARVISIVDSFTKGMNSFPFAAIDQGAEIYQKGLITNEWASQPLECLKLGMRRISAAGIPSLRTKFLTQSTPDTLIAGDGPARAITGDMEQCMSNVLFISGSDVESLQIGNFMNFLTLIFCLFIIEMFVLLVEVVIASVLV